MEASLLQIRDSWQMANQDFEESGQCFSYLCSFDDCDPPTDSKLHPIVTGADRQRKQRQKSHESKEQLHPIHEMGIHQYTEEHFLKHHLTKS